MPRVTHLQTNFTAGEISPKLYGRVDIARYQNGAEKMRDLLPQVYGGAKRRPGSLFVREVKDSTKATRLIPFVKDADTAYVLEFGHLYMRVYKNGAIVGAPYEIASPYTEAQLFEIDYTQGADTMFLFHEAVTPYKLVCSGDTSWALTAVSFVNTPFDEAGTYPAATLTPSEFGPVGETVDLMAGDVAGASTALIGTSWDGGVAGYETGAPHGRSAGDTVVASGFVPDGFNRTGVVAINDATHFELSVRTDPGTTVTQGRYTLITPVAIFSAGDVGKTIKINGGMVKITAFTSTSVVQGVIKQEMASANRAPQDSWSLHAPAWTAGNGYPRTGTLYEQRLVCAGSPAYPQTIWGSVTGGYLDFQQGTADDDAFSFTMASDVVNPIKYVATNRALVVFTSGGEFTIQGGTEKPLAPTNAQVKQRTNYGCNGVRPVRIRDAELFVQRAGRKVRTFAYSIANDDWSGPDLSVLAEHLTEGIIADMAWQQEPDSIVWLARADGALLSITLDRDQDVTAWAFHEGFGQPDEDGNATDLVESLTVIPSAEGDELWLVVNRDINGSTKRYVERLSDTTDLDCAVVSSGAAATVWTGLAHLNGETVHAVGDGRYLGDYTASGGQITVNRSSEDKSVGLNYRSRLKLLPPEIQTGMGSASGNAMRTSEVTARFFETTGCNANGNEVSFRTTGASVLDQAPEEFTGVKRIENLGFERGASDLEFTQEEPMPFHILSVTRKFTVNDG